MQLKIGSFNVYNLVRVGVPYYDKPPYSPEEFGEKADWIAGQLRRMDADIVGFQEVFHEDALVDVAGHSGRYDGGTVIAPGANGEGPRVGLATSLALAGTPEAVEAFPDGFSVSYDQGTVDSFERPVLKATMDLDGTNTITVFVAHLKSKRPVRNRHGLQLEVAGAPSVRELRRGLKDLGPLPVGDEEVEFRLDHVGGRERVYCC